MFFLSFDALCRFLLPFRNAYFLEVDVGTIVRAVGRSPVRARGFHWQVNYSLKRP